MAMVLIEGLRKEEDFMANTEVEDIEDQTRSREETAEKCGNQTLEEDFDHKDVVAFGHQDPVIVLQVIQNSDVELASEAVYKECHIVGKIHTDLRVPVMVRWRA